MALEELSTQIKEQYPQYTDVPSEQLVRGMGEKQPDLLQSEFGATIGETPRGKTEDFLQSVKDKYPAYADKDDNILLDALINKKPELTEMLDIEDYRNRTAAPAGADIVEAIFPSSAQITQIQEREPSMTLGPPAPAGDIPTLTAQGGQDPVLGPPTPEGDIPTLTYDPGISEEQKREMALPAAMQDVGSLFERALGAAVNPDSGRTFMEELKDPDASITKKWKQDLRDSDAPEGLKFVGETLLSLISDPGVIGKTAGLLTKPLAKKVIKKAKEVVPPRFRKPSEIAATTGEELTYVDAKTLKKYATPEGRKELKEAYGKQEEIGDELADYLLNPDKVLPEAKAVNKILPKLGKIPLKDVIKALEDSKIPNPIDVNIRVNKAIDKLIRSIKQTEKLPDVVIPMGGKKRVVTTRKIPDVEIPMGGKKRVSTTEQIPSTTISVPSREIPVKRDIMGQIIRPKETIPGMQRTIKGRKIEGEKYVPETTYRTAKGKTVEGEEYVPSLTYRTARGKEVSRKEVDAPEFRGIRKQLDDAIKGAFDKDYRIGFEKAMFKARMEMANNLVQAAERTGNKAYIKLMKRYAQKLKALERVKKNVGKGVQSIEEGAEGYVARLGTFGKGKRRRNLKRLDELTGSDFTKRIETTAAAAQIGKPGKEALEVPFTPKVATGAKAWALTGVGSPLILTRVILPILTTGEKITSKGTRAAITAITKSGNYTGLASILGSLAPAQKAKLKKLIASQDKAPSQKKEAAILNIVNMASPE